MDEITEKRWLNLIERLSNQFADGDEINQEAILFLIGVQELGKGYKKFAKREKQDILHIAICKVLEYQGYYSFEGYDEDGWPHYKLINQIPILKPVDQEKMIRKSIVKYFVETGYLED